MKKWEREFAQDGEFTGPGDNPPGYAGGMYETGHVGYYEDETWVPVADCYSNDFARLISAAPDMYEALNHIYDYSAKQFEANSDERALWAQINIIASDAIAKAMGR
jgi:predicted NAD-dependent protein-ADP-ribosyltransferase YbiA (DUF1768 family)